MLFLEIITFILAVSASAFSIFLHFWNKRKIADLENDLTKLREKGVPVQMDTLLEEVRKK